MSHDVEVLRWSVPDGLSVVEGPYGMRLVGEVNDLSSGLGQLRQLLIGDWHRSDGPSGREGTLVSVGSWELLIADDRSVPQSRRLVYWPGGNAVRGDTESRRSRLFLVGDHPAHDRRVVYWDEAWAVAISILHDCVSGELSSPMDFGDIGFTDRSIPDIGVSYLGFPLQDFRQRPRERRILCPPDTWPELRDRLEARGQGVMFHIGRMDDDGDRQAGWIAHMVSLDTGERSDSPIASGLSMDSAIAEVMAAT